MTKKRKRKSITWPTLTVPCPHDITGDLLRYWDDIFTPMKGVWVHPDEREHKKYRAAIKTLLEFFDE
jgi:hypothetical protein